MWLIIVHSNKAQNLARFRKSALELRGVQAWLCIRVRALTFFENTDAWIPIQTSEAIYIF